MKLEKAVQVCMSLEWICEGWRVVSERCYGSGGRMEKGGRKGRTREGDGVKMGLETYPEELAVGQHALLQTGIQEIHMVLHQLIYRSRQARGRTGLVFLLSLEARHELLPIRLDHLGGTKIEQLLDKHEHPGAEGPHAPLPSLQDPFGAAMSPDDAPSLGLPGHG